jgi:riboflavin synthase
VFTGLIDDIGTVSGIATTSAGLEIRIGSSYAGLSDGESVAVNGACLTVRESGDGWFAVAAVNTTAARTTIGRWKAGRRVNLERAMKLGDRLGGHLVQGHVDGVAIVEAIGRSGDATLLDLRLPPELDGLVVPQGSIAVDGVSLTILEVPAANLARLSLIEYTLRHTNLGDLSAGDAVHIEGDVIGKYVRQLLAPYLPPTGADTPAIS